MDDTQASAATQATIPSNGPEHALPPDQQQQQWKPAVAAGHAQDFPFVAPSSYLRPKAGTSQAMPESRMMSSLDRDQMNGLENIREFLKIRTSYDVLPLSFRLIVLDTDLLIRKSLAILIQNGIVSAPLWDSHNSTFAGLLTSTDYMNVIQYYCLYPDRLSDIDQFRLSGLRGMFTGTVSSVAR